MEKFCLIAIASSFAITTAHASDYSLPRYMSRHTWAIDNTFNCRVPSKVYTVQLDADRDVVVWRDANGSTDTEEINGREVTSIVMFSTMTVQSYHRGEGEAFGTRWFYINVNDSMIRVDKNGRFEHYLVRCDDVPPPVAPRYSQPLPNLPLDTNCFAVSDDGYVNVRESPNGPIIGPVPAAPAFTGTPFRVLNTWFDNASNMRWSRIQTPWLATAGRTGVVATNLIQCN